MGISPTSMVHESIHRGIQKLQESGKIPKVEGDTNERLTRYFMRKYYGPVEENTGSVGREQSKQAQIYYDKIPAFKKLVDQIEKAAQDYTQEKNPRGPRKRGGKVK